MSEYQRIKPIDGLRGIFALCIAFLHYGHLGLINAWLSVDYFFVLSGFVLTVVYGPFIINRTMPFRAFVVRRIARLYPIYIVNLSLFVVMFFWEQQQNPKLTTIYANFPTLLLHLFFLQDSPLATHDSWNIINWSIGIEFWASLYLFFLMLQKPALRLSLAVITTILCYGYLAMTHHSLFITNTNDYGWLNCAMLRGAGGISLGMLAHFMHQKLLQTNWQQNTTTLSLYTAISVLIFTMIGVFFWHYWEEWLAFPVLLIFVLGLPLFLQTPIISRILSMRPLQYLGSISYSLYLNHTLFIYLHLDHAWPTWSEPWGSLFFLSVLILLSALTTRYIEGPGKRVLTDWFALRIATSQAFKT